jgi:membrane protein implicated in regulation of membrane protease activity
MMMDWVMWLALAGTLVILEMFTGTFYLLMIGIGCAIGGLSAVFGAGGTLQFLSAAVTGILAIHALRRSRLGRTSRRDAARDPNVVLDIGQTLAVDAWSGAEGEVHTARVMYRGAMWDVELLQGSAAHPGKFVIREVRGSRLLVANSRLNAN